MGHGHVIPNPDGSKARCGGPAFCQECAAEAAELKKGKMQGTEITMIDVLIRVEQLRGEIFGLRQRIDELETSVKPAIEQTARIGSAD